MSVRATEILDSRGNPTVKAYVRLADGTEASASVPSGVSTGEEEAAELRDGDERFNGMGVLTAKTHVNAEIATAISGMDAGDQALIDEKLIKLDKTNNKSKLGANAILAVSLAVARAAAVSAGEPLYRYLNRISKVSPFRRGMGETGMKMPIPLLNIMNGGAHANFVTDIQEYMVIPAGFKNFRESLRAGAEIYTNLRTILRERNLSVNVGDEGGFAPEVRDNVEPLTLMAEAVDRAGYTLGQNVSFGIDAAASEFRKGSKYVFNKEGRELSTDELADFYKQIARENGVMSIEDPFAEDDIDSFVALNRELDDAIQIVGDDLYVTNAEKIREGINRGATNAVIIKPNQIGTLTETFEAIFTAAEGGQSVIISHRSGETEDPFIADLSVAVGADEIKTGAPARGERTAKYNRLLEIEEELQL